MLEFVVYCVNCQKELDWAPNGPLMEACAVRHIRETGHRVLVGYEVDFQK